jgi:hypothetical protein
MIDVVALLRDHGEAIRRRVLGEYPATAGSFITEKGVRINWMRDARPDPIIEIAADQPPREFRP